MGREIGLETSGSQADAGSLLRSCIIIVGMATTVSFATVAGEVEKEAEAKFKQGLRHAKAAQYDDAVDAFKASLELYPTQSALFNLANAYKKQNRYVDAVKTFNRLQTEYAARLDEEIELAMRGHLAELEELVATLRIQVDRVGSAIRINGEPVFLSHTGTVILEPGVHLVEVLLEGFETERREITVVGGRIRTESFSMTRVAAKGNSSGPGNAPELVETTADVLSAGEQAPRENTTSLVSNRVNGAKTRTALLWAGVGLTAVNGISMGVCLGVAQANVSDFNTYDKLVASGDASPGTMDKREDARTNAENLTKIGVGFGVAAGVFIVASTVMALVKLGKGDYSRSDIVHLTPTGVRGRF